MPTTLNLLVLIHGITTDKHPTSAEIKENAYDVIHGGINKYLADFDQKTPTPINASFPEINVLPVYYGFQHSSFLNSFSEETALADAENYAAELCPDDRSLADWVATPIGSEVAVIVKNSLFRLGLADAVFYASAEGEFEVRWSVFSQVFLKIFSILDNPENANTSIKLHFVSHSLGVTVAHDLAYLIFGYRGRDINKAGFFTPPATLELNEKQIEVLKIFKEKLSSPDVISRLHFGSFNGMEGQLPLFVFRNLKNITSLANNNKPLDARLIGIDVSQKRLQLQFQYVPNDLLGYPSLGLYNNPRQNDWGREIAIHPVGKELLEGVLGVGAYHNMCWSHSDFQENIASVIYANW